jgi:Ni,Fe-hydrogenase maturation factor
MTQIRASRGTMRGVKPYVNGVANPVDAGVAADNLVHRINHDHFVVFVDGVLRDGDEGRFS